MKNAEHIRNFCIIAHIDHGKSTLADRLLEITGTVSRREMKDQLLDQMDLERERGITIKLAPARMNYIKDGQDYVLNLIDTPGHVDFSYEVSRSLACVEGAILVVDATQGIQAQTIANLTLAVEQGLEIIPVINKIDLPNARVEETRLEIMHFLGCTSEDIIPVSAKTGENVETILDRIVEKVPKPKGSHANPLQALIFDSLYDDYQGVIAYIRVMNGHIAKGDAIKFVQSKKDSIVLEVGTFQPQREVCEQLSAGETGYVVTGVKEIADIRVGDTVVEKNPALGIETPALEGYQQLKAMVFAGIYPTEGDDINRLRDALGKLKLSDASLQFEPEHSQALGLGFRAGFLGLLHVEIVRERLLREHHMDIIMTVPSVAYRVYKRGAGEEVLTIRSAQELPDVTTIERIEEPWIAMDIVVPESLIGGMMGVSTNAKAEYIGMEYLETNSARKERRVILHYKMPMVSLLGDFYDKIKSASSGFASLNYDFIGYHKTKVVKLDILVAGEIAEPLSGLVWEDTSYQTARSIVDRLADVLPRQGFEIKVQGAIGGKIIASARIAALRKDVLAKMSGGDVTRKMKLLEKQKKGKSKMAAHGKVEIPPEAYMAVLKR